MDRAVGADCEAKQGSLYDLALVDRVEKSEPVNGHDRGVDERVAFDRLSDALEGACRRAFRQDRSELDANGAMDWRSRCRSSPRGRAW